MTGLWTFSLGIEGSGHLSPMYVKWDVFRPHVEAKYESQDPCHHEGKVGRDTKQLTT